MLFKRLCLSLSIAVALVATATELQAALISYVVSGIGSGTLAGSPFTDAPVTITATANDTQIAPFGPTSFRVSTLTAKLDIPGFGPAFFADPTQMVVVNNNIPGFVPGVGIAEVSQNIGILSLTGNNALGSYHLNTDLGPVSGTGVITVDHIFSTSNQGKFVLNSIGDVTFQATIFPEPSTAALLIIGCAVALVARRRK